MSEIGAGQADEFSMSTRRKYMQEYEENERGDDKRAEGTSSAR